MSGTSNNFWHPFCVNAEYSWSRSLYMATDLGTTSIGQTITRFGWYNNYNNYSHNYAYTRDLKIYMKATDDMSVTLAAYIQPITDGATLVYDGQLTTSSHWNTMNLQTPFFLPPNKNLLVYVEDSTGVWVSPYITWTQMVTSYRSTVRGYTRMTGSTDNLGNIWSGVPITLFGFAASIDDSNSVALFSIDNPENNILVDPSMQVPIVFTIKNKGIADLDSCYIDWTLNGVPQSRFIWRGYLPSDFNASDTIGWYSPQANQYDTIVLWTSFPNGVYDSTTYDDTLIRITYGMSGLDLAFVSDISDTVYTTGPFTVQASIFSRTLAPLPSIINLNVKYTLGGIDTYDTLLMTSLGNNIYEAIIPQHAFGTDVSYSIILIDSLGNVCTIIDKFYIKRPPVGGTTGYVIVGTGTSTQYYAPMSMFYNYSWTRQLYLANELSLGSTGGLITKLAWQYAYSIPYTYNNQSCYFKAVDDATISSTAYEDPVSVGATLVWSGTINLSSGWCEIDLTTPFMLPPGKNLIVYWNHNNGAYAGSSYVFNYTTTANYQAVRCQLDASFPSGNVGTLTYNRPNARFYIIGSSNDSNSVALFSIDNPTEGSLVGTNPIRVTIKNRGIKPLDSCVINWTLNGVLQTPYIYKGHLLEDFNDTMTIGNYIQRSNNYDSLVIWVSMPNGEVDSTTWDDTLSINSFGCSGLFSGDFIVGTSSGADFSSLAEAFFIGSKCGVSGDVTLKLQSGIYDENWDFSDLSNVMGNNTLIITSENGNRNSVILRPTSGVGVVLNNTNNLIIKDISIDNITSASYGVHFTGAAKNVEFRNVYFKGDTVGTSSTTSRAPIYKSSGSGVVDSIRFIGNLIEGGYYGIYFYGGTSSSVYGTNVVIDSNIITSQYYYGTYFYYTDFTSIFRNSIFSRTSNTSSYWYGLRLYYCNFNAGGNKIHQRSTSITSPHLTYIYYAGYYNAAVPSVFSNNELIGYSSSTYYGMYLGSYNVLNIYNNSIYMDGSGASRCVYATNSTSFYEIINNIIVNTSSSGYPIYIAGTSPTLISDYNCLYGPSYVGYLSSAHSTLAAWQTATSQDANSVSVSPSFVDVSTSLELSDYTPFVVKRLNSVTDDIKGNARTAYTTMGSYSINIFSGYNLAMTAILCQDNFNDLLCYSDYTNIQVVLKNEGTESYDFGVDTICLTLEVSGAINFKTDRLITAGSLTVAQSDTFDITNVLPVTTSGIYYITAYLTSPLDTLYDNDTVYTSYFIHRIQLPYDIDFSASHVDFVQKQIAGNASWAVEADTGNTPVIAPVFGNGRLTFHSESNPGSMSQVIFNGVNLLGTHLPKLEFWYAHDNSNPRKRDYVAIKISTDGVNTELLNAVYRYDPSYTSPGWVQYSIDLSAYANEACVSLILEGFSFGGGNQNIDRIRISSSPDISLTYLSPQLTDLIACNLSNISAEIILSNLTSQSVNFDLDTANIHFQIRGMDSINIIYPLSGLLHGLTEDTLELCHDMDLSLNGIYDILIYVDAIDDNSVNDTIKRSILINPDLVIQDLSGIDEVNCKRSGDSVYVSFKIVNMGNLDINEIPLFLQINGVNVLTDTIYQQLEPGNYINYTFAEPFIVPVVSYIQPYYMVKIQTGLSCDAQPSNNTKSIMACVDVGDVVDLKVLSIDNPLETPCDSGNRAVKVSVTLFNEGTVDIASSVLHVEVDSAGSILASFSETTASILAKSTTEHIFTQTYRVPNFNGNYTVKVFLETIANDKNTSNDTLSVNACAIYNNVSVSDITAVDWYLGQNIPNPAQTMTEIPYAIPVDGTINIKIVSISGQLLYQKEMQATAGNHSLVLDVDFLANGIYYYSMEYAGKTIVKKMTINK